MNLRWLTVAVFLFATACAGTGTLPVQRLSGAMRSDAAPSGGTGPRIGLVADSQLQTRGNFARIWGYRGPIEDWAVPVSIRPPALDWAARSMLRTHLEHLKARGAEAIFYLGDGANNGCYDEVAAGFDPPRAEGRTALSPNDQGILALLDNFRREARIPVYFVLGNHDLLGAGSTSRGDRRAGFCRNDEGTNRPLAKIEIIALVDRFNRGNAAFAPVWTYESSYRQSATEDLCGNEPARQHRTWGCYLAARVDYRGRGPAVRYLLLDTNDWVNVSESRYGSLDQEGLRGAMSFGIRRGAVPSQTGWFQENAGDMVPVRVALTHYNVPGLRKSVPIFGTISSQSQQFMTLFSTPGSPRTANQQAAYVISAHTHDPDLRHAERRFRVGCRSRGCEERQLLTVDELNIGSTTDFSNYSVMARVVTAAGTGGDIFYERVETEQAGCADLYAEVENHTFPYSFRGQNQGWRAIGVNRGDRHNYRRFALNEMRPIWANLESYAGSDAHRANCIGLVAAALEKGEAYLRRLIETP